MFHFTKMHTLCLLFYRCLYDRNNCSVNQREQIPRNPDESNNKECNSHNHHNTDHHPHPTQPAQLIPPQPLQPSNSPKPLQPAKLTEQAQLSQPTQPSQPPQPTWTCGDYGAVQFVTVVLAALAVLVVVIVVVGRVMVVMFWGLSGCVGFAGCFATNNYAWALRFPCCGECTQPEQQYLLESAMIKKWPGIALVLVPKQERPGGGNRKKYML